MNIRVPNVPYTAHISALGYTLPMQYLIDASVYVFRAYYSMPDDMVDADGNPINALYGFARFLGDFIEQVNPEHVAVAFDESLTTSFRTSIYPEYLSLIHISEPTRRTNPSRIPSTA